MDSFCCIVNERKGESAYTCTVANGSSVVDYLIVPLEDFSKVLSLRVFHLNELIHELFLEDEVNDLSRPPDHNLLHFEIISSGSILRMRGLGCPNTNIHKSIPRKFINGFMMNDQVIEAMTRVHLKVVESKLTQAAVDDCYGLM